MKKAKTKTSNGDVKWVLIDAENQILGRLAVRIAVMLSGKDKTNYSRHLDVGDHVIVINVGKIKVTGQKKEDKSYKFYSGFPGGLREVPMGRLIDKRPTYPLMHAVKGMLPKNSLGNHMLKKLRIYIDSNHPHVAQQPKEIKLN